MKSKPPVKPDMSHGPWRLAHLLEKLGEKEKSHQLVEKSLEINQQALGAVPAEIAANLTDVARLQLQIGNAISREWSAIW